MANDERTAEKEMAPHLTEEIDARNFVCYRHGQSEVYILDEESFLIEKEKHYSLGVQLYHLNLFDALVTIDMSIEGDEKENVVWTIYTDSEEIHSQTINLGETKEASFSFRPTKEVFDLNQICTVDEKITAHIKVSVELRHGKSRIVNDDLGCEIFYVDRVILGTGDSVSFGSLANVIKNEGQTKLEYIPVHPITTRSLHFLTGKPQAMFYYLRTESRLK